MRSTAVRTAPVANDRSNFRRSITFDRLLSADLIRKMRLNPHQSDRIGKQKAPTTLGGTFE